MRKRWIAGLLVVCLCAGILAGCGGEVAENGDGESSRTETSATHTSNDNNIPEDVDSENDSDKWLLVKATSQGNTESSDDSVRINPDYVWGVDTANYCEFTYTYDENGNMLTMDCVSEYGEKETRVWSYNDRGQVLSYNRTNFIGNTWSTDYTYDEEGNQLTKSKVDYDGSVEDTETIYNENGQKVSETIYESIFGKTMEYSWTYHENGEKETETLVTRRKDGSIASTVVRTYNASGDILTKVTTTSGNTTEDIYIYDSTGNLLSHEQLNNGISGGKVINTYDSEGKMLTTAGGLAGEVTFEYDNNGNLSRESGNGGTTVYEYNEDNVLIKNTRYIADDGVEVVYSEIEYEIDANGNLLCETKALYELEWNSVTQQAERQRKLFYVHSYTYDDKGNLSSKTETDYDQEVEKTWKYDEHGNLIEYTVWYMDEPSSSKFIATFEYEKMK